MGRLIQLLEKLVFFVAGLVLFLSPMYPGARQLRLKWLSLMPGYCQRSCM